MSNASERVEPICLLAIDKDQPTGSSDAMHDEVGSFIVNPVELYTISNKTLFNYVICLLKINF